MTRDWEETFSQWASPPGKSEEERLENAARAIRDAVQADDKLRLVTKVFLHGSYRNRVNVRQDSDVDVGLLYTGNSFGVKYPEGKSDADFGNEQATYLASDFKDDVGRALISRFGSASVERGNKAFHIRNNSYRVEADAAPMFIHRRYSTYSYICGVQIFPDRGPRIVNWPERLYDDSHWPKQHYENGVEKNAATSRRYKGVVRILKKLRNEMEDGGVAAAVPVSGFVIECMTWNVPNQNFGWSTWDKDVQAALSFLWNNTGNDEDCSEWGEVSDLEYLFKHSPTKRAQAHTFVDAAWDYVGVRK